MHRSSRLAFAVLAWATSPLGVGAAGAAGAAGAQVIGQGFELERAGRYEQAASAYFAIVRADPVSVPGLLGLERVLPSINRLPELIPLARRAVALDPQTPALQALLLRTFVGLGVPDSAAAVALRWAEGSPRDPAPYREWALALEHGARRDEGRRTLLLGRRVLGPSALAVELAELLQRAGDWEGAAREWATAVTTDPSQAPNAAAQLVPARDADRALVTRALTTPGASVPSRRVAAELLLKWGDPGAAWTLMEGTLATATTETPAALRRFADLAATQSTPEARRAR
ncbi:MAG: hypothetical protein ACREMV_07835, partial [Gemmatimonadales bacterium]